MSNIPDLNQRVRQLIDFHSGGSVSLFAKKIQTSQQKLNRLFNIDSRTGKYPTVPTDIIIKITEIFVDVNANWLLNGVGEMFEESNANFDITSKKVIDENFIELPYVSLAARATFSASCDTVHEPQETYNTYRNSTFDYNNVKVLEVNGDSMEPTLVSGEKVLIREVSNSKWEYFTGLAAVSFKDMFVVKRITRNSGGILTLNSDNPHGGSFDVKIDDICNIYKIEHSVYRPLK